MIQNDPILFQKAISFAARRQMRLGQRLGLGKHGIVLVAESNLKAMRSAIKIHSEAEAYHRERSVYERLAEHGVKEIEGFNVPQLLSVDDELLVIEMTVVTRPYVLDFASAYLDRPPEFPAGVLEDWEAAKREEFEANWKVVESVLQTLRWHGVYLFDVNTNNIAFLDRG